MNEPGSVELKLIHMEDVVSKEVEWLWYPYIPYGKITIIEQHLQYIGYITAGRRKNNTCIDVGGSP